MSNIDAAISNLIEAETSHYGESIKYHDTRLTEVERRLAALEAQAQAKPEASPGPLEIPATLVVDEPQPEAVQVDDEVELPEEIYAFRRHAEVYKIHREAAADVFSKEELGGPFTPEKDMILYAVHPRHRADAAALRQRVAELEREIAGLKKPRDISEVAEELASFTSPNEEPMAWDFNGVAVEIHGFTHLSKLDMQDLISAKDKTIADRDATIAQLRADLAAAEAAKGRRGGRCGRLAT